MKTEMAILFLVAALYFGVRSFFVRGQEEWHYDLLFWVSIAAANVLIYL